MIFKGFYLTHLRRKWWWMDQRDKLKRKLFGPPRLRQWFDVRSALTETYANTLIHWSENLHSFDPDHTEDEWKNLLQSKGEILLAWLEDEENPEKYKQAQEVYRWTADNLATLWD